MTLSAMTSGVTATRSSVTGLHVGASGFSYPEWRGPFYPERARPAEFLGLYAARLPSVEINTTFYDLPSEERIAGWRAQVPDGFVFAAKMSRRITQFGAVNLVGEFCERMALLGDRLGPLLVQLPDTRPRDDGLLKLLIGSLDPALRYAFELRHESWSGVEPILDAEGIALVGSLEGAAPFRYLRLRESPYDDAALRAWAERLIPLLADGIEVYVYVNKGAAPDHSPGGEPTAVTATRLLDMVAAARSGV
jgi:uncharacterized protein YecE (DUF72 family)